MKQNQKSHMVTDQELIALTICSEQLSKLCFDQLWRVMHYLIVRHLGRGWAIGKPASALYKNPVAMCEEHWQEDQPIEREQPCQKTATENS